MFDVCDLLGKTSSSVSENMTHFYFLFGASRWIHKQHWAELNLNSNELEEFYLMVKPKLCIVWLFVVEMRWSQKIPSFKTLNISVEKREEVQVNEWVSAVWMNVITSSHELPTIDF
jgi:hypothetical protein